MTENLEKTIARILKIWFIYIPVFVVILGMVGCVFNVYNEAKEKRMAHERIMKRK